jgi:acyl-CoA thioesterase-1
LTAHIAQGYVRWFHPSYNDLMTLKRLLIVIGLIVIATLLLRDRPLGPAAPSELNTPLTGTNVIAFGDSLTEGVGATPGQALPDLLARELKIDILNKGRAGDTTRNALVRLEKDVLTQNPRVVILLFGGNDALQKIPVEETFANLKTIIAEIKKTGARTLLLGVRGNYYRDRYQKQFHILAHDTGVVYIPDVLDGIIGDPALMYDLVHPNDAGYRIIASRVAPELSRVLQP